MQLIKGNIFDSKCDTIVNPVNVVGAMGGGLALAFKERYPNMFKQYKRLCVDKLFTVGVPRFVVDTRTILLFPTKEHWMYPSKIEYVQDGLDYLSRTVSKEVIKSIAFPLLGCGLGGLDRKDVLPLIEKFEKETGIICEVYEL